MIDIIILVFLSLFLVYGLYRGLVKMVLNLLSSVLGIILSIKFYEPLYDVFPAIGFGSDALGKTLSFLLILSLASFVLSFGLNIVAKVLKIITSLPVVSIFNRLAGGVFGLVQGLFVIGAILFVLSHYAIFSSWLDFAITNSELTPIFVKTVYWIKPFLPEALKLVQSNIF